MIRLTCAGERIMKGHSHGNLNPEESSVSRTPRVRDPLMVVVSCYLIIRALYPGLSDPAHSAKTPVMADEEMKNS